MAKESLQLAVHFLFHTYLHTKKKLRYVNIHTCKHRSTSVNTPWEASVLYLHCSCISCRVDTEEWMATVDVLLSKSSEACQWMVHYLVGPEGREITRSVKYSFDISDHISDNNQETVLDPSVWEKFSHILLSVLVRLHFSSCSSNSRNNSAKYCFMFYAVPEENHAVIEVMLFF